MSNKKKSNQIRWPQVYSIYKYGYKIFINMEYAENGDLYTYLQSNTLTEPQIRMWTMQILWAFRYMHTAGVVHRDMKCENVLLTGNFNVRIADFGFTRFVGRGRNPGADTVCGTLAYSAPELLAGTKPYNPMAVDVWAIGVVVFMMANNVAPFRDKFKEDMYKKQVTKHFGFRKVLGRSDYLKRFTAMFLEPNVQERVQIKNALQSYFIKIGNVKTPSKVQNTATEENNHISTVPIINEVTMKSSSFTYQISGNVKSISFFNTEFIPVEDSEAGIFRED
ncbi:Protein kinase domain,Protein kinase-like domain,Serine/threonine-protein kinase, active site [Cinara cedri]|uniref:Protein kinase domain,Protein kinase-like domain,Serine/threonine-protein kinase, active site n=1 Tax=Cinara cedri TaxID=506608 RepID=A0A5E4N7P7_9HEMI|nr:Protein kinase domain,Protein kinase-like domain,Serine/threonine-protein kinase, active site [Cinara cedri]